VKNETGNQVGNYPTVIVDDWTRVHVVAVACAVGKTDNQKGRIDMTTRFLPILASISGLEASVIAGMPNSDTLDAFGRWPLTVILGAVCVACVYFMYLQAKNAADRAAAMSSNNCRTLLDMAIGEREAAEKRTLSHSQATRELAEANAKVVKDLAENHAKELRTLLDEIVKRGGG
jgi:cbb3-type cytochrome oxidase subunit 3